MEDIIYEYYHDKDTNLTVSLGKSNVCRPHFHRSLEILYLFSGKMHSQVGGETFIAQPNDIIFVHSYYRHAFSPITNYRKIFLVIPSNYDNDFHSTLKSTTLPPRLTDKKFNAAVLRPLFQKLLDENDTMPALVKKGYLNVILGSMFDHYPVRDVKMHGGIELLVGVLNYIDEHYAQPITLNTLADTFGYNKYYFSRLFNGYIGESISNYINIVRLQNFMRLRNDDEQASVADLAFSCGFDSLTTFYRYFKKLYAVAPRALLKKQ